MDTLKEGRNIRGKDNLSKVLGKKEIFPCRWKTKVLFICSLSQRQTRYIAIRNGHADKAAYQDQSGS
ncbi:hypothetical protein [Aliamphritea hakodatensis]|uniref:hypothetical protein n=1 Tax=Aliamphritea hakodatensis TaxID=2895352 RepID=UPI0022FD86D1|nr:hypothetical protein [Aliamphritea hakodatensis]